MTDYLTSFLSLFLQEENQLLTMFASGLLSSTLLPGNSEIVFSTLVSQQFLTGSTMFSPLIMKLLVVATAGNSLGSFITYLMGRLVPKPISPSNRYAKWALDQSEKYGVWALLLSWLPIVGDLFCGIAGWLRFKPYQSLICILLGKFARYIFLVAMLYPTFKIFG